jgi:alanyl-tRNA synthetase
MQTRQLIRICKQYFTEKGYKAKIPGGLINPAYPDTFNPCSGHSEITQLAKLSKLEEAIKWFALEPVFRHLDAQKVGVSKYHSSFFEMLTYVDARRNEDSSKKEIIFDLLGLYNKELGIDFDKLHVTVFGGYNLLGKEIPADRESLKIWGDILGKERVHPLRSTSNMEFFQREGEQAGPRCEIFYKGENRLFEIGTVVFDDHVYKNGSFHRIPNSIYGGAGGIERLEMAVNGFYSIHQTGTFKPFIDIITKHAKGAGNLGFLRDELITATDNLKSAILISAEGQSRTNKTRRGQRLNRLVNDAKRNLERLNIRDYATLCKDFAEKLSSIYGQRYPFYQNINPETVPRYLKSAKSEEKF